MARYIDADALMAHEFKNDISYKAFCNLVKRQPAADVAPVRHGEWIYGENEGQDGWYCSECRFFIPWYYDWYGLDNIDFIKDFHACPHCGAKMDMRR